ncbi:MAG: hypothetical protein AAFY99_02120 [Pseudomonadota bacterium]
MMMSLIVYPVTGFAIAFCAYFFHAAWAGWRVEFNPYSVRAYGVIGSTMWFALTGPVISARLAHIKMSQEDIASLFGGVVTFAITLFWATMIGVLFQELARPLFG